MLLPRLTTLAQLITLLGCAAVSGDDDRAWMAEAARAHQEAQKTGICEVHKVKMTFKAVPIRWGEAVPPGPGEPSYQDRMQHFPNYITVIEGGCVKIPGRESRATFICSRCKDAAMAWKKRGRH